MLRVLDCKKRTHRGLGTGLNPNRFGRCSLTKASKQLLISAIGQGLAALLLAERF